MSNLFANKKNIIILVLLIAFLAETGALLFLYSTEKGLVKEEKEPKAAIQQTNSTSSMKAGEVGEVMVKDEKTGKEAPKVSPTMPPAIFSTIGTVTEIKSDKIIVRGNGKNFADRVPRDLTVLIRENTKIFNKDQSFSWQGLKGLNHLQTGMKVLIGSSENIRGKVEFIANTINILK